MHHSVGVYLWDVFHTSPFPELRPLWIVTGLCYYLLSHVGWVVLTFFETSMQLNSKILFAFLSLRPSSHAPALFLGPVLCFCPSHLSPGFLAQRPCRSRPGACQSALHTLPPHPPVNVFIIVITLAANSILIAAIRSLLTKLCDWFLVCMFFIF